MKNSDSTSYIYRYSVAEGNVSELSGQLLILNQDIGHFRSRGTSPAMMASMIARIGEIETAIARATILQDQKRLQSKPAVASNAAPVSDRGRAGQDFLASPAGRHGS
ncbi:hypothetical protein [Azospirillum doebereinerae]|uniref:Uncharacterized protein n=1 Tax=Azospirillum doebereinerae TaxID=92933 RepID=A0A433J1K9_9PROT|nr:hypothetical protein [Azospirillum doebereinerae]MCG5241626.1 hypothetical protein [Azospirillum doebereinerae]RUQ64061.1 hypothetical protein EJ913_26825 [Azospirillum doebereinerae]